MLLPSQLTARKTLRHLFALYLLAAVARFLLALALSGNPWVMPDESLYLNLTRSLFTRGEVLLRGQPVKYLSLLYPLLLSPLYALPASVDLLRGVQLLNSLMMNAVVFPAWYLARRVTGSYQKAWAAAVLCLLLPDLALTQVAMAENAIFPLLTLVLLLAHRELRGDGKRWEIPLIALLCGLLYFAKPGLIAAGLALCVVFLWRFLFRERTRQRGLQALSLALGLGICVLFFTLLPRFAFGVDGAMSSVYERQTQPFSLRLVALTLQGGLLHAFFFTASMLFLPLAIPAACRGLLDAPERWLLTVLLLGAAGMALGAGYAVYPSELAANPLTARVHLRYLAPFLPALMPFVLSSRLKDSRLNGRLFLLSAFFLSCAVFLPPDSFLSNRSYPVDALLLSPIAENWLSLQTHTLFLLLLCAGLLTAGLYLHSRGFTTRARNALLLLLGVWLALGNLTGYDLMRHNTDTAWTADASQAAQELGDDPGLFVAEDGGYLWNAATALDARLRREIPFVELDDLIINTTTDGSFRPFLPRAYWTETPARHFEEPGTFLMPNLLLSRIALAQGVGLKATDGLKYALLTLPQGQPWVHSALSGFRDNGWVKDGSKLTVFDPALISKDLLTISLYLYAREEGTELIIGSGGVHKTVPIKDSYVWIAIEVPVGEIPITVNFSTTGQVFIQTYLVQ